MGLAAGERRVAESSEDGRLAEAHDLLEHGSFQVLSLDVFDTLLWRRVPEPVDAFVLLGNVLRERGHLSPQVSPHLFARLRERAEWKARRKIESPGRLPEISLETIYDELPAHLFDGAPGQEIARQEVAFEATITFPDLDIVELAHAAQHKFGARIALVSDTYFSEQQLRRLIDRDALSPLEIDRIFTSSQYGTGKGADLYRVVLDELGLHGEAVLHIGDNLEADVERSRAHGIRAVHFDKYPGSFKTVLEREGLCRADGRQRVKPTLHPVHGDFGLTAVRSKTLARSDQLGVAARANGYWRFGASVLGPVFTAFAEWVHGRAVEEGLDTVYCLMREGEFLTRLVNGSKGYLGSGVWARPLWLSRQVCSRASIAEASVEELSEFLNRRVPPTLSSFCRSVGVEPAELPDLHVDGDARLDDPELARQVLACLSGRPEVRTLVLTRAGALRTRLVDYLVETLSGTDRPAMLVDIGWGGTIQLGLDRSLAMAGLDLETIGLYLLTNDGVLERMLDGLRAEGFLASGGLPHEIDSITRSPEILEQVCMHDSGSLVDFGPDGSPVHGPVSQSPSQVLQRTAVQAGILAFQQEWGRYRALLPAESRLLDARAHAQLIKMVSRFTIAPTTEEAGLFAGWLHDDNYGSKETETMAPEAMAASLPYMTPRQVLELPMTKLYWPSGLIALHDQSLALGAAAIADGSLPPDVFDPGRPCQVHLLVDKGGGFGEVLCRPSGPNSSGQSYLRAEIGGRPIRGVMLRFSEGPSVVRVDWLRLVFSLQGQPEARVVVIQTPEDFRGIRFQSCTPLSDNLVLGTDRAPEVVYACPPEWAEDVYKVEVEARFAWMPQSAVASGPPGTADILLRLGARLARRAKNSWLTSAREANERFRPRA